MGTSWAQTSELWVDFEYPGLERGTSLEPFDTLGEAMGFVDAGGTVHVLAGASHEFLSIDQPVTLAASGGVVRLGDLGAAEGSGSPYEALKITELMYNPGDGGAEYLELQNTGFQSLNVSGVYFSDGVDYSFPAKVLAPGEYAVLVRDTDLSLFLSLYSGVAYAGVYGGALSNGGETISLSDPFGNVFLSFTYNDAFPWPAGADGGGFSLVIDDSQSLGTDPEDWRASDAAGGAPGEADPDANNPTVVISEALTHTDAPLIDAVEFHNLSSEAADIRGWYLTDDKSVPQKALIPDRPHLASIPAGGFTYLSELDFFDAPGSVGGSPLPGFRLSSHGEDLYLYSANAQGNLTGYSHGFGFGGAENGVSFGRVVTSDDREHFVAQASRTFGASNAGAQTGAVVISAVHYHPLPNGIEYVELTNTSGSTHQLWDTSGGGDPSNTYRISGIGFSFPPGTSLAAGEKVLVVDEDPLAYVARFGDPGISVYGPFENDSEVSGDSLSNGGETLRLQWPDTPDEVSPGVFEAAYIDMDTVRFNDAAPWPDADGSGNALVRVDVGGFGGEPTNWTAPVSAYQPGFGVAALSFSTPRGFYDGTVDLTLSTTTPSAVIRYTTDGSLPTISNGSTYSSPVAISSDTVIRASGFRVGYLNSSVETHTYIMNADAATKSLPAISLVGDPGASIYEPDGVMAIVGGVYVPEDDWYTVWKPDGPGDYNNPIQRGIDFERPVSFEYIAPLDNSGIQEECGVRVHGSSWHRDRYYRDTDWTGCTGDNLNYSKFSFRLLFRQDYGAKKLEFPLVPESILSEYDQVILRGGHNDTCDPFLHDELARRLMQDMGHVTPVGTMNNLFVNGDLKGFYNPTERIDEAFLQSHYPGSGAWDVITSRSNVRDGDDVAWWEMMTFAQTEDLSNPAKYDEFAAMLDVDAFIDYLIHQLFTNNSDWPTVNWIAGRERAEDRKWKFFIWDSEFAFLESYLTRIGFDEYPQNRGDGLNGEETEIAWIYRALRANPTFDARWAERTDLHLFGAGALASANVLARFAELEQELADVIPGMSTFIPDTFVPIRYDFVLDAFEAEGLWAP